MKPSIRHGESAAALHDNARRLDLAAETLLRHAGDCDRWGFVDEASDVRGQARSLRVRALLDRAAAAAMDGTADSPGF